MIEVRTLVKANIPLSVRQIPKMVDSGKLCFENSVQRGYEWDKNRQSLLIMSLLQGYPTPPVFARRGDGTVYDMLDGKQRLLTIQRFVTNQFQLVNVPMLEVIEDGEEVQIDLNGSTYADLHPDIRATLDAASIVLYYYDDITEDETCEIFFRLNNMKPVSTSCITRVRAASKGVIKELGQHPIFKLALTEKALTNYTNEDMVIKAAYLMAGHDNLETKNIREWIANNEIDRKLQNKVYSAMSRLETVAKKLSTEEENKKTVKKILTKTHFLSLLPIIDKATDDKVKDDVLTDWINKFFGVDNKTSISSKYNDACGSGSAKKEAVTTRQNELEKSYNKAIEKVTEAA